MTDGFDTLSAGVRWGTRLAVVGVVLAVLVVAAALLGIQALDPLYWAGILLAIGGIVVAAILGGQSASIRYTGGVILTMAGVPVLGYGIESGRLLILFAGAVILIVGILGVVVGTRRTD